jgi:UrcA family protein
MIPPALAETRTITADSQRVAYSDLDLTSQAGARTLLQRIHVAAATACTTELANSPLTPRAQAQFQQCTSNAETAAVARVGAPLVASLYNTSIPKSGGELFAAR